MDNPKLKGFLSRKDNKNGTTYNFDLYPLMQNFSFYDFCDEVRQLDRDLVKNHGGILVITDKQYILSYNSSFGIGTHMGAGARIYKDIHGGGEIVGDHDAISLNGKCQNEYVIARLIYEYVGENSFHRPMYQGYIHFVLTSMGKNREITEGMLNNFIQFYNDYNDEIKLVNKKFGFIVSYSIRNEANKVVNVESSDLDNLYEYLKTIVNTNIPVDDNEVIIGNTPQNAHTK